MIKVIEAKANDDYSLDLKFSDGSVKRFDVKPYLDYEVFKELESLDYFKQIKISFGTVQWKNEQDISPETLHLEGEDLKESIFYGSSQRNEIEQLGR
jgi:hypothetical protein